MDALKKGAFLIIFILASAMIIVEGYNNTYQQVNPYIQTLLMKILEDYRGGLKTLTISPITSTEKNNAYYIMATAIYTGGLYGPISVMDSDIGKNYFIRLEAEVIDNIYREYSGASITISDTTRYGKYATFQDFIGQLRNIIPNTNLPVIINYSGHGKVENGVPVINFWDKNTNSRKYYSPKNIKVYIRKNSLTNVLLVYIDACYSAYNPSTKDSTKSFKALFINYAGALYFIGSTNRVHSAFAMDLATHFIADLIHNMITGSTLYVSRIFRNAKTRTYNRWMDYADLYHSASHLVYHAASEIAIHIIQDIEVNTYNPYALLIILDLIAYAYYLSLWGSHIESAARTSYNSMNIYYLYDVPPNWSPL